MNFEGALLNSNVKMTQITKEANAKYLETDDLCNWKYDTKSFRSITILSDKKKEKMFLEYRRIICNQF